MNAAPFPHLSRWLAAVAARPAVQRGLKMPEHSPLKEKQGDNRAFIERTRKLMGIGPRQA